MGDDSNASSRAEQNIEPSLRGHIRFGFHQQFANFQVSCLCSEMQCIGLTARDVRGGGIFGIIDRGRVQRQNTTVRKNGNKKLAENPGMQKQKAPERMAGGHTSDLLRLHPL
jgi:hypothetical protein